MKVISHGAHGDDSCSQINQAKRGSKRKATGHSCEKDDTQGRKDCKSIDRSSIGFEDFVKNLIEKECKLCPGIFLSLFAIIIISFASYLRDFD